MGEQQVTSRASMAALMDVIKLLADGEFHSGELLGRVLGVSRAAVWKRLQLLQEQFGLQFESVRGRGYRLVGGVELLDAVRVRARLPADVASWLQSLELHEAIDSTNRRASHLAQSGLAQGVVVVAEHQTAGSGRRGRRWVSPFGRNIYCSMLWSFEGGVGALEGLSLVVGLVVARVLSSVTERDVTLKWPNDVLVDSQKVAGVLLELIGDMDGRCTVTIGVGVNVNMVGAAEAADINQSWTDVASIARGPVSRNELLSTLIAEMIAALRLFERSGFAAFRDEWLRLDYLAGRFVTVEGGGSVQAGRVLGLDISGALLLDVDGVVRVVHGGEVSVRPVH